MKHTISTIKLCLLILLLISSCRKENQKFEMTAQQKQKVEKLDSIANAFLQTGKVLGFSIAVLQEEDVLFAKSFGYIDSTKIRPATNEIAFPIASVTKPHTAVLALKLQERNLLRLEDFLFEYYPNLPFSEEMQRIKLVHLLNHTSGLPDYIPYIDSLFLATGKAPAIADYFNSFKDKGLYFDPGTQFSYSNTGFVFMTDIIEKVAGKNYDQLISELIASPIGLSTLGLQSKKMADQSASMIFEAVDTSFHISFMNDLTYIKGDGGLSVSAIELARLPFELVKGTLIDRQSFNQMSTATKLDVGTFSDYGLGLRIGEFEGHKIWGHTGGAISPWCVLAYFPEEKTSIVVTVNTDRTPSNALEIFGFVALAVLDENVPDLAQLEKGNEEVEHFMGNYFRPDESEVRHMQIVKYTGEPNLYRKMSNSKSKGEKLFYLGHNTFAPESAPMDRLVFQLNDNMDVVNFKDYYNGLFMGLRVKE